LDWLKQIEAHGFAIAAGVVPDELNHAVQAEIRKSGGRPAGGFAACDDPWLGSPDRRVRTGSAISVRSPGSAGISISRHGFRQVPEIE
jgi:hypothetical protein